MSPSAQLISKQLKEITEDEKTRDKGVWAVQEQGIVRRSSILEMLVQFSLHSAIY